MTLKTAGAQTITATDTVTATITGATGTITVTAATPITLASEDGGHGVWHRDRQSGTNQLYARGRSESGGELFDAISERDAGDAYGDDAGNFWRFCWRAHGMHGDGKYVPVYDYRYGNCDGDVYAGTRDIPADRGGWNSAYGRRNDHECAGRDQLHVDGNDDERDLHAEFPSRDTGDVDVCAWARVGFLRLDGDDAELPGEQRVSCLLNMSAATTATVEFTSGGGTVNVTVTGAGNVTDTANAGEINCTNTAGGTQTGTCSGGYSLGAGVTLTATPAAGATFAGWTGASCTNPTAATCSFQVINTTPIAVGATFAASGGAATHFSVTAPATATAGSYV